MVVIIVTCVYHCYIIDALYSVTLTQDILYTWCTRFTPHRIYDFMHYRIYLSTVLTNLPY